MARQAVAGGLPGQVFYKDPDAFLDYKIDWTSELGSDTILSSTWVAQTGISAELPSHTPTTATVWLRGGTLGQSYAVVNRITTAGGRVDDRTLRVVIRSH